jgi:hypothetical protein
MAGAVFFKDEKAEVQGCLLTGLKFCVWRPVDLNPDGSKTLLLATANIASNIGFSIELF